jgi:LytS/YehU family sensor histidine kinase
MNKTKIIFKQHKLTIIGVVIGLIGGFLYWYNIGCTTVTCPITSSPFISTIYGGFLGGLLFSLFKKKKGENKNE